MSVNAYECIAGVEPVEGCSGGFDGAGPEVLHHHRVMIEAKNCVPYGSPMVLQIDVSGADKHAHAVSYGSAILQNEADPNTGESGLRAPSRRGGALMRCCRGLRAVWPEGGGLT